MGSISENSTESFSSANSDVEMNMGPSTSQKHCKKKKSRRKCVRSAVRIALFATLLIWNFVNSAGGVFFFTQHVAEHQSKAAPENLEKNLTSTSIINKLEVVSDYVGELAAQNLNLSKELEFLQKRTADNFIEWSSEMKSMKNSDYQMRKGLGIIDRKLNDLLKPDCGIIAREWNRGSGVFDIFSHGKHYKVYCDTTTDGGGWTVFQRRMDGSIDFYVTWEEYAKGFGNKAGEFWLGLENIHQLTQGGAYELRVDLTDWDGSTAYAKYGTFSISGRSDNYRLTVGEYSGSAGDSLTHSSGIQFTAKDKDLDPLSTGNCAVNRVGAWWFQRCGSSSLNGKYNDTSAVGRGIYWFRWKNRYNYCLKASEMKFRKK